MESNNSLIFFILGLSLLPKIYSDMYPPLIVKKPNMNYAVADEIHYVEDQYNIVNFSTSPEYQLFSACPAESPPDFQHFALNVQKSEIVDFEEKPLQQFIRGFYVKYNCQKPVRPIVLTSIERFEDKDAHVFDIGFLIHEWNTDFGDLWKKYPTLHKVPYPQNYDFIPFLTITMDRTLGIIKSVCHRIISRGLLEPVSALNRFQPNEKNIPFYGFDVNSLYTEENQETVFSSIFGKQSSLYYDHKEDRCFIKVQLAPHEDFLLETWKLSSFMDLNTTAMWKQLYDQWRIIEIFVRKVARDLEPLIVKTGTAEILTLTKDINQSHSVYLRQNQKSPAAKYIFKQITFKQSYDDANIKAILIVMHNDPYTENQKPICEDVGKNLGWMVSNNDYKTGLTYVCPVDENITSKLHIESKGNYASLNLNNVWKLKSDENDNYPSLFIIKKPNTFYAVADKFQFIEGHHNAVKFSPYLGDQLYNACPEKNASFYREYILKRQESVTNFEARPLEQFVNGEFVNYDCSNPIKPVALELKRKPKNSSLIEYHLGFLIHEKNAHFNKLSKRYKNFPESIEYFFLRFLTIMWDSKSGVTLEAGHQIVAGGLLEPDLAYSSSLQHNEKNVNVYGFDINSLYTEENQQEVFSLGFGQSYSNYYNPPNRKLRKVQLAPHEDFLLNTWKLTSFMDLNTTAMWEQLYDQWRRVEIFVRGVARELGTLKIQTGASKILALPNIENKLITLYLRKFQKFPVCTYIWKLITFKQSNDDVHAQGILIIMHNDPYTPDQDPICDDLSESLGWAVSNKDYETGLTYVCQVQENTMSRIISRKYSTNHEMLDLNNMQKLKYHKNDIFPSLFIMKTPDTFYTVADKFEYFEGQENVKFSILPGHQLYNACPEENAPFHPTYALKVQKLVTDFEYSPLQGFVKGFFLKYNCQNSIKPIVLKTKTIFEDTFLFEYDIGFLIREENGNFDKLSELYENFPEMQEYNFLDFLTITMDRQTGTILSVVHRIISGGLMKLELPFSGPFPQIEKNEDIFGFDVKSLYTEENQQLMFYLIFGPSYTRYYNHPNKCLRSIQLAPHKDFLINIWKLPSFMGLNLAAMWEQLYDQWRRIEIFVREVAQKLGTLTIETGAARILTLPDAEGTQQPVYLREKKKSPVTKYFWKLIQFIQFYNNITYTQAILVVMHNDPYTPDQKPICEDVSENWGWMVSNKDYETGLTYGCPVNESITTQLHDKFNVNYASFNLNDVQMFEHDENSECCK